MTWVVQLPEGSRPGKHEILVPEGEVDLFFCYNQKSPFHTMKYKIKGEVYLISTTISSFHFTNYIMNFKIHGGGVLCLAVQDSSISDIVGRLVCRSVCLSQLIIRA